MKYFITIIMLFFGFKSVALVQNWSSSLPESSNFKTNKALNKRVNFWVKVYSQFGVNQGVFHLIEDPALKQAKVDFSDIYESSILSAEEKENQVKKRTKTLRAFYAKKWNVDEEEIRLQMGLREKMRKALFLSGKYIDHMEEIFAKNNLPIELTRLVFVESSFNIFAQSKVGASGLWQIMPNTARPKGYIQRNFDKRNHPIYATKLAAEILKTNYQHLKSWPLAITAYNHGLTGVKRMMKRSESVRIEDMIDADDDDSTPSWGFASRNFYACFLAVLEVERNATELFGENLIKAESLDFVNYKLPSRTKKSDVLKWFDGSITRFRQMNPHLNWALIKNKSLVPAGVPLMIPEKNFAMVEKSRE